MNKKLMVGALAVALVAGGFAGSTLLSTTHAATTSTVKADAAGRDQEVEDATKGTGKEVADDQQGQNDKEVSDDNQGQDQETNDDAVQSPAGK